MVRFSPGERALLRSLRPDLATDPYHERFSGGDDTLDLLEIRAAAELGGATELHGRLATRERPV